MLCFTFTCVGLHGTGSLQNEEISARLFLQINMSIYVGHIYCRTNAIFIVCNFKIPE